MPHLLTYSASFSRDIPASWYRYRDRVLHTLSSSGCASVVTADDEPIFTYGVHPAAGVTRINEMRPGAAQVVLAQWTAVEFYSASVVILGDDVSAQSVKGALRSERLLREHSGEFATQGALMFGYQLEVLTDDGLAAALRLARRVPNAVYVADRPAVNDGEGEIDHDNFEVLHQSGVGSNAVDGGLVVFRPRSDEAEADVVRGAARNNGVAVLQADDWLLADVERFAELDNELALFLGGADDHRMTRVTIERCHIDDSFVAVYGQRLETEVPLSFLV